MKNTLDFDETGYTVKTCTLGGETITCRAFMDIPYCAAPAADVQKMNIFVPESYYHDGRINGYSLHTAPIFMPNTVGGYMEGPADEPGIGHEGQINSVFRGLQHGYVVVSAGVRGRTTGTASMEFFEGSVAKKGPHGPAGKPEGTPHGPAEEPEGMPHGPADRPPMGEPHDSAGRPTMGEAEGLLKRPSMAESEKSAGKMPVSGVHGPADDSSEEKNGRAVGKAPALIVDMKAAIRYLRKNKDHIPGDTEHIITNGTSAGGALSALAGATGNSPDYEPYLEAIGAAKERDDVFAASCYCPIHNLEHADMAYEWLFAGQNEFHATRFEMMPDGIRPIPSTGMMTDEQIRMSAELKAMFPAYVNSLDLVEPVRLEKESESCLSGSWKLVTDCSKEKVEGANKIAEAEDVPAEAESVTTEETSSERSLTLNPDGTGSFADYVKEQVIRSAQKELDTHDTAKNRSWLQVTGSEIEAQSYLTVEDGKVTDINWNGFVKAITRMKATPAFDSPDLKSPENEEFGTEEIHARHFTDYSAAHSTAGGEKAPEELIHIMNPVNYVGKSGSDSTPGTAKHWRIRHGAFDRDTSLAIPVILAVLLENRGYDVDFFLPWGLPHSGDYDLEELFAWIDGICREG